MNTTPMRAGAVAAAALLLTLLAGCAKDASPVAAPTDAEFQAMMARSFRAEGIAGLDRLQQDAGQQACSTGRPVPDDVAAALEKTALAGVRPPDDGQYLGDWKAGEALAQNGRGMTWSDRSAAPSANGGSCYNCHQITKAEIAFGTIGPSLYQYGKLRGVADPKAPEYAAVVQYTWNKINDAWAYHACSNMPRFGHRGLLDQKQMKDLMALLLDPASPVNAR